MKEVYKGLFTRIRQAYPLDYYWLWTDENWTWSDANEKTVQGVVDDALIALAAAAWNQEPWGKSLSSIQEEGPVNGIYVSFPGKAVAGTKEQVVYQDIRDRVFGYSLNIPNGTYNIVLKFREGEIKEKGRRVFDISLEGKMVAEKVDIFGQIGADRIHYPAIAGIVVEGEGFSKKINCGGGDFGDYEAD